MATRIWRSNVPAPKLSSPPTTPLDDAFFRTIALLASAPVRSASQSGEGAVNPDGLNVGMLRQLADRWCSRTLKERRYSPGDVYALALALSHFSDEEFADMARGAVVTHLR
ncbi:MAG: hypothetical protein ACYC6F_17505 [Longimicrobiales bacterium]